MDRPTLKSAPRAVELARERLRAVVFAEYGIGKSTLAMTFPRPLVINTDDGLISVTALHPDADLGVEYEPDGHQDLEALGWWIVDHSDDIDSVVVDSGDELVFGLINELVERGADYDRGKGKDTHPVAEFVPEQAEYLANQRQMHAFLTILKKLKKHVIITFGVRAADGVKTTRRGPDVAPGLAKIVMRWASVAGELLIADADMAKSLGNGIKAGDRLLATDPGSRVREGKSRFPELHPYVVNPTFDKLWAPVQALYDNAGK